MPTPKNTELKKFKLLRGVHSEGGKIYKKGDVINTSNDLLLHNKPNSNRFILIDDKGTEVVSSTSISDGLDEMTKEELIAYAEEGDINLSGCNTKSQIIEKIRSN